MSVYTDSCRWISFTGSRMRESRTSGSERGKPRKGLTYLPMLQNLELIRAQFSVQRGFQLLIASMKRVAVGSVKKFVSLEENDSFLVRITI